MKYENYIFDLYGTLVDIHTDEDTPVLWEAMAAYYSQLGASYQPAGLRDAFYRITAKEEADKLPVRRDAHEAHPEIKIELVFRQLFLEKGVEADSAQAVAAGWRFRQLSTEYIRLYDGAAELLRSLREQGGVWLLSNAQSIFTTRELDHLGLTPYFDGIYLSSDFGIKKPDYRFFQALLQGQHIMPERAIMIGNDGLCDIQGGREAGLSTFYIHSNLSPDEPPPVSDYVLDQMDLRLVREMLS